MVERSKSTQSQTPEALRSWPSSGWESAGFPLRHRRRLLSEVKKLSPGDATTQGLFMPWEGKARERALQASQRICQGDGLILLVGPRGPGKTQLATELALVLDRSLGERGRNRASYLYRPGGGLLDDEKAGWDRKENGRGALYNAGGVRLRVLDEIQEVSHTEWSSTQLTRLIDDRYQNMRSTIMIANLELESVQEFVGASAWSRIKETGLVVPCDWGSFR